MSFPRYITRPLLAALADTPVVMVVGARQTGKSTLAQSLAVGQHPAAYLTLDEATVLSSAQADPVGFLAAHPGPVVIDEIQRVPALLPAIKAEVDRRRRPGRYLLTGSANVLLLSKVSESLAGRMEVLTLWPLAQGEIEERPGNFVDEAFAAGPPARQSASAGGRRALVERALRGGFPEAVQRDDRDRRRVWFDAYITTILQRDVRDLARIESLTVLPRLLALIAARAPAPTNVADLGRGAGLAQTTLRRYLSLLEMTFLVRSVPAWARNLTKRLVRAPRLVLTDTGLLAHLAGWSGPGLEQEPTAAGPLIENFVLMEIIKVASWSRRRPDVFHFRTHAGQEVDVVLEDDQGRVVGVETKAAASVSERDFRGLEALRETAGKRFHRGVVLYAGRDILPFGRDLWAMPIESLWPLGRGEARS